MTQRVFDCRGRPPRLVDHAPLEPRPARSGRGAGLRTLALAALVLVPLAGASEPPYGWTLAALAALGVLGVYCVSRGRARWGWLGVLVGLASFAIPREPLPGIGPALFVIVGLSLVLWFTSRSPSRSRLAAAARQAQLVLGASGERQVSDVLARELPDDFVLINGLKLPDRTSDFDHVVVGPTGVFLLETKTMAGRIVCHVDGQWSRTKFGRGGTAYQGYIGNPAAQVQHNVIAARNCLRRRLPQLFGDRPIWIQGVVVFPHPETELVVDSSHVPALRLEAVADYISHHTPRRRLAPAEVDDLLAALLAESAASGQRVARSAQALVELALALPLVLGLVFGSLALSRIVQAQTALVAIAHEAARAAALGANPDDARSRLQQRTQLVAPGFGLDPAALDLSWDLSRFGRKQGQVRVTVRYHVDLSDLPLVGWLPPPGVAAEHVEWVDPFRSGIPLDPGGGP